MTQFATALGLAGMLQAVLLPGYILLRTLRLELNFLLTLGISCALSLPLNYALVVLLIWLGLCTAPVVWGVMVLELAALVWLMRRDWSVNRTSSPSMPLHSTPDSRGLIETVAQWLALAIALIAAWYFLRLFWRNLGTVFVDWDPALSWNYRATAWAGNAFPGFFHNYPDIVPVTFAVPYIFMGSTHLQYFSKALTAIFPLAIIVILIGLWGHTLRMAYLIAAWATGVLLVGVLGSRFLNEGYADPVVAFVAVGAIALLALADKTENARARVRLLWLAIFMAAATAHTKQVGLAVAGMFPILIYFCERSREGPRTGPLRKAAVAAFAIGAFVIPWYWAASRAESNSGSSVVEFLSYLAAGAGARTDLMVRIGGMFHYLVTQLGWPITFIIPIAILITAVVDPFWRRVLLFVMVPFWTAWLILFSYDARNQAMALPFFGIAIGVAGEAIVHWVSIATRIPTPSILPVPGLNWVTHVGDALGRAGSIVGVATVAAAAVASLAFIPSVPDLVARQSAQLRQTGEELVNAQIYAAYEKNPGKIISNYSVLNQQLLPGLENAAIPCRCTTPTEIDEMLATRKATYILLRLDSMPDEKVQDRLLSLERSGQLVRFYEKKAGRVFVLYRVATSSLSLMAPPEARQAEHS